MKSLCRACGETFTTVHNFEKHRRGQYSPSEPGYGRRCLTPAEMLEQGWRATARGWTPNVAWEVRRQGELDEIGPTRYLGEG